MNGGPKKPTDKTSSESEPETGEGEYDPDGLILVPADNPPSVVDDQVSELQEQLAEVKDEKNELIFYFILALVIFFDVFAFAYIGSAVGIVVIAFFECLLMLGAASRLGVEEPAVFLRSTIRAIQKWLARGSD